MARVEVVLQPRAAARGEEPYILRVASVTVDGIPVPTGNARIVFDGFPVIEIERPSDLAKRYLASDTISFEQRSTPDPTCYGATNYAPVLTLAITELVVTTEETP